MRNALRERIEELDDLQNRKSPDYKVWEHRILECLFDEDDLEPLYQDANDLKVIMDTLIEVSGKINEQLIPEMVFQEARAEVLHIYERVYGDKEFDFGEFLLTFLVAGEIQRYNINTERGVRELANDMVQDRFKGLKHMEHDDNDAILDMIFEDFGKDMAKEIAHFYELRDYKDNE